MIGTSGPIASESYLKWDQNTQFWRTSQASMWEMENGQHMGAPWLDSFPKSGICQNGELYPLPMLERPTSDPGGGSWPTPTSRDHKDGDAHSCQNVPVNGLLGREVHMLPTPSSGGESGGPHGIRGGSWPTPKSTNSGPDHARQFREGSGGDDLVTAVDGSLSPDWVSWLMGLPVGWTSLDPLPREEYDDWFHAQMDGTWWLEERGLPRVAVGIQDRVNRLKCLGNGIVPASGALAIYELALR